MTLPATGPGASLPVPPRSEPAGSQTSQAKPTTTGSQDKAAAPAPPTHGLPGGRVVTVATLLVIVAALAEVLMRERIGLWSTVTLLIVSVISPIITRPGDRSLPAMMPPLAFLTAVVIAGQGLVPQNETAWRTRQAVMIVQELGANAVWVIVATVAAVTIGAIGHFVDRRIARRAAAAG